MRQTASQIGNKDGTEGTTKCTRNIIILLLYTSRTACIIILCYVKKKNINTFAHLVKNNPSLSILYGDIDCMDGGLVNDLRTNNILLLGF